MAKYKIEREVYEVKVNAKGNILEEKSIYYVYRSKLFGIIRNYIHVAPKYVPYYDEVTEYDLTCFGKNIASKFTKKEAEALVKELEENPDKFVFRYYAES